MVKLTHIHTGIIKFYEQEIAPHKKSLMFFGMAMPLIINNFVRKNATMIELLADENGDIDIDTLHNNYTKFLENNGPFKVPVINADFDAKDLDKLVAIIKAEVPVATPATAPAPVL